MTTADVQADPFDSQVRSGQALALVRRLVGWTVVVVALVWMIY